MNDSDRELYEETIKQWGKKSQLLMAIEEMAELTVQLSKVFRGKANGRRLAEEIADVEIMMEQLRVMYPKVSEVADEIRHEKLYKLRQMLDEEGK